MTRRTVDHLADQNRRPAPLMTCEAIADALYQRTGQRLSRSSVQRILAQAEAKIHAALLRSGITIEETYE